MADLPTIPEGDRQIRDVWFQFYTEAVEDRDATRRNGHTSYNDVDFVRVIKKGTNATETVYAVRRLKREDQSLWSFVEKYYDAWKKNQEPPTDGTPIAMATFLTPAQVKTCQALNVLSIEDLANVNDATMDRLGMGFREKKMKAQAYLAAATGPGKLSEEMAALREEMAALRREREESDEANKQLHAELEKMRYASQGGKPQLPPKPQPQRAA